MQGGEKISSRRIGMRCMQEFFYATRTDILRAKSPYMIDKEIAVHLIAYNLVRGLMARATAGVEVTARALSFKGTLQLRKSTSGTGLET